MCRCLEFQLENIEEKEERSYDMAINLLMALVFVLRAERSQGRYLFDEETNEVEFL